MQDGEIIGLFEPLWDDVKPENEFYNRRPLLAHYTSMPVFEKILQNNEIWFSNPLFMNDMEEVRFGINVGYGLVLGSQEIINACETKERAAIFRNAFTYYYQEFDNSHVFDTYVFCFSEHQKENVNGILSMWRGYGANGDGVAIVFDADKLGGPEDNSPFILAEVVYAPADERRAWIQNTISRFSSILQSAQLPDKNLHLAAWALFDRLRIFALFTKHDGFKEEKEWRAVYLKSRDPDGRLKHMYHYLMGPAGIQPKLRLKIEPIEGVFSKDGTSLEEIVHQIILGPALSTPLAIATVKRMLECVGRLELVGRVSASTIPFRSRA